MTIRREDYQYIDSSPPQVASIVRQVLERPPYTHTREQEQAVLFKTKIKPNWLYMPTEMTVHLQPSSGRTRILAEIKSQWWIMGDVYEIYTRYLREFLREVELEYLRQKS
jgi:hypothetical protein